MLTVNLFDLIDQMFRGVVFFFYNIVTSIAHLIRHPISAPFRLYRRHKQAHIQQVAGITLLFVCAFALLLLVLPGINANNAEPEVASSAPDAWRIIAAEKEVSTSSIWPAVLGALAITIMLDLLLRTVCRFALNRRGARLDLMVSVLEYAAIVQLLAVAVCFVSLAAVIREIMFEEWAGIVWALGSLALLYVCSIPTARMLAQRGIKRSPRRRHLFVGLIAAAVALIGLASTMAGLWVGLSVIDEAERAAQERSNPTVENLKCWERPDGTIQLDSLVTGGPKRPYVIEIARLEIELGQSADWSEPVQLDKLRANLMNASSGEYLLIDPGKSLMFSIVAKPKRALLRRGTCNIRFGSDPLGKPTHLRLANPPPDPE